MAGDSFNDYPTYSRAEYPPSLHSNRRSPPRPADFNTSYPPASHQYTSYSPQTPRSYGGPPAPPVHNIPVSTPSPAVEHRNYQPSVQTSQPQLPYAQSSQTMSSRDSTSPPLANLLPIPPPPAQTLREPHANHYAIPPPAQRPQQPSPPSPATRSIGRRPVAAAGMSGGLTGAAAANTVQYNQQPAFQAPTAQYEPPPTPPHAYPAVSNPFVDPRSISPQRIPYVPQHSPSNSWSRPSLQPDAANAPMLANAAAMNASSLSVDSRPRSNSYNSYRSGWDTAWPNDSRSLSMGEIDPMDIDDENDELHSKIREKTRSNGAAAAGVGGGAVGGLFRGMRTRDASGNYGSVPGGNGDGEKVTGWRAPKPKNRRWKLILGGLIGLVIGLAIIGGIVGAVLSSNGGSSSSSDATADPQGELTKDSSQVQSLLNNGNLHKIFPGIDYTPINTQYPACLSDPPNQNNVTLDMAILTQLTGAVRLYGTDCNQTEMVLTAIDRLGMTSSDVKVWAGVWLDNNQTTNDRQLRQMYDVFDKYGADPFAGVIVGNEVLFRQQMTESELADQLTQVRSELSSKGINIPVSTSDLGSSWTAGLADASDIVMANVHPYFAGIPSAEAASWTWTFWQNNDVAIDSTKKQIISETGWPSQGGNDCGTSPDGTAIKCSSSTAGSVASIDGMNTFLSEWACNALSNNTDYFWFEAFDEPWKIQFDKDGDNWEDHWGLFDVDRNLKAGVTIPSCDKTATVPS